MWFSASIITTSLINDMESDIVEENIVIVDCMNEKEANEKLRIKATEFEIEYRNDRNEVVKARVKGIYDLQRVINKEITSGVEIFCRHYNIKLVDEINRKL